MREISGELEENLRNLAHEKFKNGETYKNSSSAKYLMIRYGDWIVEKYRVCSEGTLYNFYKEFRLE